MCKHMVSNSFHLNNVPQVTLIYLNYINTLSNWTAIRNLPQTSVFLDRLLFFFSTPRMEIEETKMTRTTLLFCVFLSLHAVLYYIESSTCWLAFYASILPVAGILLAAAFLVIAARATLMTWITVLVLLAFSGKCRRVLALQGRRITADVAIYLAKVVFRGKGGAAALVCATFISFLLLAL